MPPTRDRPTITDYAVTAVSPVLIMAMLGSLVFFLIEVLYRGAYHERLLYTMFFFVGASVLVSRISINSGYGLASAYGLVLALVTFIALQAFVEYPTPALRAFGSVVNVVLMALIWWAANKLTWDCTHLDEGRKTSGRGMLSAAGLASDGRKPVVELENDPDMPGEAKKRRKDPEGVAGWFARWSRYRDAQKKKPHTPGVWVIYFALACVPVFALGQSLIPADDAARRGVAFRLMAIFVGSGLGLLVTTSLLGLRKYLRERNAKVPAAMTAGWLGLGAGLIVLFLAVGAILPRPHSETPLIDLGRNAKADRKASKNAVVKDGSAGKGDGAAGKKNEAGDGKNSAKGGKKGGNAGEKGDGGGKGKDQGGKGKDGDKGGDGKDAGNGKKDGDDNKDAKDEKKDEDAKGGPADKDVDDQADDGNSTDADSPSQKQMPEVFEKIGSFVKWVVWIVIAVIVVVGIVVFFLKYLAPFTAWARGLLDWLRSLFAGKPKARAARGDDAPAEIASPRSPPFSAFANPFDDGSAKRMTPAELITYTVQAFEAWATDRDLGRPPGETPDEFAARIGDVFPDLDAPGRRLAALYARVLYSPKPLPADAVAAARAFWDTVEQPVAAAD